MSYVTLNLFHEEQFTDHLFWLFIIAVLALYPIHKCLHFLALFDLRQHLKLRVRVQFYFIPVLHMRIREPLSKNRYILALLTPFFCTKYNYCARYTALTCLYALRHLTFSVSLQFMFN